MCPEHMTRPAVSAISPLTFLCQNSSLPIIIRFSHPALFLSSESPAHLTHQKNNSAHHMLSRPTHLTEFVSVGCFDSNLLGYRFA